MTPFLVKKFPSFTVLNVIGFVRFELHLYVNLGEITRELYVYPILPKMWFHCKCVHICINLKISDPALTSYFRYVYAKDVLCSPSQLCLTGLPWKVFLELCLQAWSKGTQQEIERKRSYLLFILADVSVFVRWCHPEEHSCCQVALSTYSDSTTGLSPPPSFCFHSHVERY